MKENVIVENSRNGFSISKGDRKIELSPEATAKICDEIGELGKKLVEGVGGVTVEYFKSQVNMYYCELNAYLKKQAILSDERQTLLNSVQKTLDDLTEAIKNAEGEKQIEGLKEAYKLVSETYITALKEGVNCTKKSDRPKLLTELKGIFSKRLM